MNLTSFTAEDVRAMIFELARSEHKNQFTLNLDKNVIVYNDREYEPFETYKLLAHSNNFAEFLAQLS